MLSVIILRGMGECGETGREAQCSLNPPRPQPLTRTTIPAGGEDDGRLRPRTRRDRVFTRRQGRKEPRHAARPGDAPAPLPADSPQPPAPPRIPVTPEQRALSAVAAGNLPLAVSHLSGLSLSQTCGAAAAGTQLGILAAAVARRRLETEGITAEPPPAFRECLDCLTGTGRECADPMCARHPAAETPPPAGDEAPAGTPADPVPDAAPDSADDEDAKDICD